MTTCSIAPCANLSRLGSSWRKLRSVGVSQQAPAETSSLTLDGRHSTTWDDLGEHDFVKAKHAQNFQDLLDRPYGDFLAEEIIKPFCSQTIVKEMEIDDRSAPASEPASGAGKLTAEEEEHIQMEEASVSLQR